MASFSIPLTGLNADATELNTIANNLSNLSTTGFKSQTTSFEDLFYQQVGSSGSGNPVLAGQGVKVSGNTTNFSTGSSVPTGNPSDVALSGNGFFVVNNGGTQEYTRAGNFQVDPNGNLTTSDGMPVLGYSASNGVVNTNAPLTGLQIPPAGQTDQPKATTQFALNANLDASAPAGTVVPAQISLYDSLGKSHIATVSFTKGTTANTWNYAISLPSGDYTGATANTTGTLTFNSSGQLASPTANVTGVSFAGMTDGASNMKFNWDLYQNNTPTVTQVSSSSSVASSTQDGFASGTSTGFSIAPSGVISVQFSNGQNQAVGQLAVATVNNEQGLARVGGNNYAATLASGQASMGVAGAGGRGAIEGGALEQSNVSVSTQFSDLIVAQNAYEANAKSVSTFNSVAQATISMIP